MTMRFLDDPDPNDLPEESLPWPVVICIVAVGMFLSVVVWMLP